LSKINAWARQSARLARTMRRRATDRILALALTIGGGTLLGFLIYQSFDRTLNDSSIYTTGMPGSLLLGLGAIIAVAFGVHRLTSRRDSGGEP
jgi:hypothetical protein